eukprot:1179070-Prorocentrum_minimum.AAC.1
MHSSCPEVNWKPLRKSTSHVSTASATAKPERTRATVSPKLLEERAPVVTKIVRRGRASEPYVKEPLRCPGNPAAVRAQPHDVRRGRHRSDPPLPLQPLLYIIPVHAAAITIMFS